MRVLIVAALGLANFGAAAAPAGQNPPAPPEAAAPAKPSFVPPRAIPSSAMKNWPVYSQAARQAHREGVVLLNVRISAQGAPVEVKVARSSTFEDLDLAAVAAVRNWQFTPATRDGTPTETNVTLPINFSLKAAETPPAAAASAPRAKPASVPTQDKPKPKPKIAQKPASKPKPEGAKPDPGPVKSAEPEEPAKEAN